MKFAIFLCVVLVLSAAAAVQADTVTNAIGRAQERQLPEPYATESAIKFPEVIGWPEGTTPQAPQGFTVSLFAELENPRWLYQLPNGDILIAQSRTLPKPDEQDKAKSKKDAKKRQGQKKSKTITGDSPNKITLLRDKNQDGQPEVEETFLAELNQPFGMALVGKQFFVACTDAVWVFKYEDGATRIDGKGMKVLDLPAGGYNNHWTRNILPNREQDKLFVTVGSASNVAEHGTAEEILRANILECNLDGTGLRVFASGLRNPNGLAWEPVTGKLWTTVNERDGLGDNLVPDFLTSVRENGFYGWPFAYFGANEDPRLAGQRPDLVKKTIIPDVPLGSHTAALGLAFCTDDRFPEKYRGGAFIGLRGSWNRSKFAGYQVAFVPFAEGLPMGKPEQFLAGFIANENQVYGRPVGVVFTDDGSLLVADEPGNTIWRVSAK
jgi:glucose/arabinose dehydrogenase